MVYRHLDGTECLHALTPDSFSAEGLRCTVTNLDVLLDDGGPRTGRITVVLADDEGRFEPDVPLVPVYPPPPPSRYLDGPSRTRQRHRGETPGMFESWPHALWMFGVWAVFSGLILGALIGLVWVLLHVLS